MKERLGHYDIIAELGRGGMGVVYKGHETSLNRYVAIKVLAESLAHDESVKERFLREARSMAALNDPHIISIYYIGDDAGQPYFVMEFVDGESLGSLLKREGKLKPEQAAKIVCQTAQGLSSAHDKGVIHRDIKPGNLMLTSKGSVKIADFGIALSTQDFSKKLTSTGEFVGTPGYLSPEVCQGKPVDQRSDIFSLGIVLFECLAGRMPFTDESPLGLMLEVVKADIPDVRTLNAEVDPELERILARMVAKDPADRYQSCQDLVADLLRHPLVANGPAALALPLQPAAVELPRQTPTRLVHPLAPVAADAVFSTEPATALRSGLAASSPLLRRTVVPAARRKWAVGAVAAGILAVSAWAFRSDLPFVVTPPASDRTTATAAQNLAPATAPIPASVPASTAAVLAGAFVGGVHGVRFASRATGSDDAADEDILDSLWLNDLPDDALDPGNYDYAAAAYSGDPRYPPPAYAPVAYYPPYAVPAVPVAYYAPSPWRFGFGLSLGLGAGWWATHYYYAPVFIGPVIRPGFAWSRPLLGTAVGAGTGLPSTPVANRPLPGSTRLAAPAASRPLVGAAIGKSAQAARAVTASVPASSPRAALAAGRQVAMDKAASANPAHNTAAVRNARASRQQLAERQARRAQIREQQQARREQVREQQQARTDAKRERQESLEQRRAAASGKREQRMEKRH